MGMCTYGCVAGIPCIVIIRSILTPNLIVTTVSSEVVDSCHVYDQIIHDTTPNNMYPMSRHVYDYNNDLRFKQTYNSEHGMGKLIYFNVLEPLLSLLIICFKIRIYW